MKEDKRRAGQVHLERKSAFYMYEKEGVASSRS